MAKTFACSDLGADCPGRFTTETEDELWKHFELHVREAHPGMEITPELEKNAKSVVKET